MRQTSLLPEADLQVDLHVDRCSASGRAAVVIVVDGIPATASLPAVVASILGSLQAALGARLEAKRQQPIRTMVDRRNPWMGRVRWN